MTIRKDFGLWTLFAAIAATGGCKTAASQQSSVKESVSESPSQPAPDCVSTQYSLGSGAQAEKFRDVTKLCWSVANGAMDFTFSRQDAEMLTLRQLALSTNDCGGTCKTFSSGGTFLTFKLTETPRTLIFIYSNNEIVFNVAAAADPGKVAACARYGSNSFADLEGNLDYTSPLTISGCEDGVAVDQCVDAKQTDVFGSSLQAAMFAMRAYPGKSCGQVPTQIENPGPSSAEAAKPASDANTEIAAFDGCYRVTLGNLIDQGIPEANQATDACLSATPGNTLQVTFYAPSGAKTLNFDFVSGAGQEYTFGRAGVTFQFEGVPASHLNVNMQTQNGVLSLGLDPG
jgi:hypothetical protein